MKNISDKYLKSLLISNSVYGSKETCETFGIKQESLSRYLREARKRGLKNPGKLGYLKEIKDKYSDYELKAIAKGGRIIPGYEKVPIIDFSGERIRIGAIGDTHIGHLRFDKNYLFAAFEEFKKEKVDFIVHAGDVTEGMSSRVGHIYELSQLGYEAQKDEAIKLFSQWTDTDIYAISGNHDRWFYKAVGANIVLDIDNELTNFHFIGHDEGDISLKGEAVLKLFHGEDSSSYALSYRGQKIIESLHEGEKPDAIITGHVHKYMDFWKANIHFTSVGSIEKQTRWMRSKRIDAHPGFAIIDYWVKKGIRKKTITWYPFS